MALPIALRAPTPELPSKEELVRAIREGQAGGSGPSAAPQLWLPLGKSTSRRKRTAPLNFVEKDGGLGGSLPWYDDEVKKTTGGQTSADEVANWVYDPKKRQQILSYLQKKGYEVDSFAKLDQIWQEAVGRSADAYGTSGGRVKKSPWDMLDLLAPSPEEIARRGPLKGLAYSDTTTTTHIAQMGPETAKGILTNALKDALGRDPTDEEIEDFASRANAIVSENPSQTRTTTNYVWDEAEGGYRATGQTSRQVGPSSEEVGAMVQGAAEDEAEDDPEYGAYQAAGVVSNWLFNAIQSPTG